MNEDETFGVKLKLLASEFKQQLSQISKISKTASKELENDMTIAPKTSMYDKYTASQLKDMIDFSQETIRYLNQQIADASTSPANKLMYLQQLEEEEAEVDRLRKAYNNLEKEVEDTAVAEEKLSVEADKASGNISRGFNKLTKKGRQFLLSLFSIRTAWALISRASSAYLAENEALAESVSLISSTLGNILGPTIAKIIDLAQYAVIWIAKTIELFTGYNALASVVANSNKKIADASAKASKSMNKLNGSLAGFDTITNIAQQDNDLGGIGSGVEAMTDALTDFQKKVAKINKIFEKWEKPIKYATTALLAFAGVAMLAKLAKLIGSASGLTGLAGVGATLKTIAGLAVITISIIAVWQGIKETQQVLKELTDWQKNALESQKKYILNQQNINQLLNDQDANVTAFNELVQDSLRWDYEKLGLTKDILKQLERYPIQSQAYLDKYKEILANETTSEADQKRIVKAMQQQYDTLGTVADRIAKAGGNTKDLKKLQDEYMRQIIITKDRMGENTEELRKTYGYAYNTNGELVKVNKTKIENKKSKITFDTEVKTTKAENDYSNFLTRIAQATTRKLSGLFSGSILNSTGTVNPLAGLFNEVFKSIFKYDVGTNYIPNDQLAFVHKGEMIVPKKYNPATSGIGTSNEMVVAKLDQLITTLENKDMNAYISSSEIGQTATNYINSQSRIMGRSVIQ